MTRVVRPRAWWIAALAVAGMVCGALSGVAPPSAVASVPPADSGWTLDFSDDFTGPAGTLPSSQNWLFDLGTSYPGGAPNWGTGEVETMTSDPANVSVDGAGNLRVTPLRDSAGRWTSARIETQRNDFAPPAGGRLRVEASIRLPAVSGEAALGYWPAFWMLGGPFRGNFTNWPSVGEVDIMENVQGQNLTHGVFHCGVAPGGPCNEFTGIGANRSCSPTTCQQAFHTYRFEWDRSSTPETFRWFQDGVQFHSVNESQFPADVWDNATNHGYMIILNVAMGGGFPASFGGGPTAATASGVPMVVDYVAVWRSGGGAAPPPGTRSAYTTLEAESFDQQQGVRTEATTDTDGGQNIGSLANGDWARYSSIDFGATAATQFVARVASGAPAGVSGLVEVRLDSVTSPPVGSMAVANTGGWQAWRTVPANLTGVTGVHQVFLTFSSGQLAEYVNVNWFTFSH